MGAETKMNSEDIKQLLETKPYHKEIAPQLEEYVGEQIGKGVADLDANTALLKLYQFYPELAKVAVVRKILVLALMSLPASDFQLCLFLVSEKVQEEPEIASIASAWEQLETADFGAFWESVKAMPDVLGVPKMADAIRSYIVTTLSITYLKVPKSVLCSSLQMQLSELKSCPMLVAVAENNCIDDTDSVAFNVNKDNHFVVQGQQVEDFATVFSKVLYSSAISSTTATSPAQ